MFDPGGVLHAALRGALRRSHECFARGGESPTVPSRASPKQSGGDIGGSRGKKRKKAIHPFYIWILHEHPLRKHIHLHGHPLQFLIENIHAQPGLIGYIYRAVRIEREARLSNIRVVVTVTC